MEMGIPKHKAEVALEETGNVGIEVATEWLFSAPDRLLEQLSSDGGSPSSTSSMSSSEETIVTTPKRVPLKGVRCAGGAGRVQGRWQVAGCSVLPAAGCVQACCRAACKPAAPGCSHKVLHHP
jgi:hypothetical protein